MPKQLDVLLRHAQQLEKQAQAHWLQARQKTLTAQAQLTELQAYVQDYSPAYVDGQLAAGRLLNQQLFFERLKQAVQQQSQLLQNAQADEAQQRGHWQQRYRRQEAVQLMQQRRLAEQQLEQRRQEQRQLDELSNKPATGLAGVGHA